MPGPIPYRALPSLQRRFAAVDDEKFSGVSMNSPSPISDHVSPISVSGAQKRCRQEVHRLVKEAMVMSAQPHPSASVYPHQINNFDKSGISSSRLATATKKRLQESVAEISSRHALSNVESANVLEGQVICVESVGVGAKRKYMANQQLGKNSRIGFHVIDMNMNQNPFAELVTFVRSCIVPEGYPESVSSSYTPYMQWRALKYFFGGAMSVFTTRSLLHAVGVSRQGAASTAVAVNWVIKDGAGRLGKMLFARHGKKFDCDMKQLRFTGDLLMELGAAVELATVAAPHLFLPLACAANIAKNVAAVTSTSTRAPIYKAFARGENIGDVTAKGECISNIADLLGTGLGIFISKRNPSLIATFAVLSCGYLCCSFQEVKSVLLPTLNRARFGVAVQSFLDTGRVPSLSEGNQKECIFTPPWVREKSLIIGAKISEAFQSPSKFLDLLPVFQNENYLVTYNSSKRQAYVVLKEKASSDDVLRAAFHAQLLSNIIRRSLLQYQGSVNTPFLINSRSREGQAEFKKCHRIDMSVEGAIRESCKHVSGLFEAFKYQATSQGWIMAEALLNPSNTRLCSWKEC